VTGPRTIVDVMSGLWAQFFPLPSFKPWLLCAAAMHGLTYGLTAADQAFVGACLGLPVDQLPRDATQRPVIIVGRRGGKGRFVSALAVFAAAFRDYSAVLAPGERGVVVIVAPDRRQCRVVFRYIKALLELTPMLAALVEGTTKDAIQLTNGIDIEVHTASFRSIRGYTVVAAILEEAGFLPPADSAEPDTELITALLPAMANVPGAFLAMISSPYARRGELWKAFAEHFGKPGAPVRVWKASTRTMNAGIPQALVDRAYQDDPAAADAEYGANFRTDAELLVSLSVLEAATMRGRHAVPRVPSVEYVAFVDPSGGSSDEMTLAVASRTAAGVAVVHALEAVAAPFNPDDVVERFAAVLRSYGLVEVTGDAYGGEWPRARFAAHGIEYRVSDKTKTEIYKAFLPLLNGGRVELLDEPRMLRQFERLERRTTRGGREVIDHPPGGKDDRANAAAGALVQATTHVVGGVGAMAMPHWL
jgi:hypothetical protein